MVIQKSTIIVAIVAFCAGAGLTWLVLNQRGLNYATQPPTYIISQTAAPAAVPPAIPPDVSQLSPGEAAVTLGNASYDEKNWAGAIANYQRAISLGTDTDDIRTDLGNALRFSGAPQKALEQYQLAQRMDQTHENSLYNMATLYAQELHDPASAARTMQDYLRRFPNGDKASIARQFIEQSGTTSAAGN
ncbi:MAG: tetratricopeptide repeat protein [Verrucomicrobiota bacterium]